jgi:predicted permease
MEDDEVQQALRSKQHRWLFFWRCGRSEYDGSTSPESLVEEGRLEKIVVVQPQFFKKIADPNEIAIAAAAILESTQKGSQEHAQKHHPFQTHVTFQQSNEPAAGLHEMFHSGAPTLAFPSAAATVVGLTEDGKPTRPSSPDPLSHHPDCAPRFPRLTKILSSLRTLPVPPTIALLLACPISVITPLKALFVPIQNANGSLVIPFAPDGAPPLAFILDTTTFLGTASVPLALICLGAALAKLKIPKGIKELPLGAISALTIGRLVLQPIVAIVTVEGLVTAGLIDEANKVLRFAMM